MQNGSSRPPPRLPPTRRPPCLQPASAYAPPPAAFASRHRPSSSIYDNDEELEEYLASLGEADEESEWAGGTGYEEGQQEGFAFASFSTSSSPTPRFHDNIAQNASRRFGGDNEGVLEHSRTTNHYANPSAPVATPPPTGRPSQAPRRSLPAAPQQASSTHSIIKPMPIRRAVALPQPAPKSFASSRFSAQPSHYQDLNKANTTSPGPGGYIQTGQVISRSAHEIFGQDNGEEEYWHDEPGWSAGGTSVQHSATTWENALMALDGAQSTGPQSRSLASTSRQPRRVHEDVQYLEDVEEALGGPSKSKAASGTVRAQKKGIKLRPVSELPDIFRSLWRFGVFNAVQSLSFDTVYHSDENVVISAPTGSGKTVLFELAIIRLFTQSDVSDAKVLYMAPTKSLCSERVADWKKKFEQTFGWVVQELTGDTDAVAGAWREVANASIIVTTPEKWDAMTRKWHDHGTTLGQLRLFCIDEVHCVGTDVRGAVLEVVVSRMKTLGTDTRFVAVSATVPNIDDIADWLGAGVHEEGHKPAKAFTFGDHFRPCKLQKYETSETLLRSLALICPVVRRIVVGYPKGGNDFAFANGLNFKLFDLIKQYASGKPVLVFCNTRKGCTQAAEALAKAYKESLSSSSGRASLAWPKPARNEFRTTDKSLASLLENGLAVHHAGMDANDRRLVERAFIEGTVSIVCSTSTLAVGVNLPARMVIIKGTKAFIDGQLKDYSDLEILQMIGRAGRPQFDTLGVACIMTDKASESRYANLVNAQASFYRSAGSGASADLVRLVQSLLESGQVARLGVSLVHGKLTGPDLRSLHKSLTEHVNSEITLGTIGDIPSALRWLRSTFLFVRITKNPAFYAIPGIKSTPEARLEELCLEAIKELVGSGVVDEDGDKLAANHFGDASQTPLTSAVTSAHIRHPQIMAKFYISHKTFLAIKELPIGASMRTLLETLCSSAELNSFRFRQGERTVLAKYNKNLRFPTEKVATTADRVMILIQLVLEGIPGSELRNENINPMLDARGIFAAAVRVAKCMVDVAVEREDGAIRTMLELLRSLNGKCWDASSFVLRQLEGIGEKSYKVLVSSGIKSFEDVRECEPERLEILLSRKPPFGRKLIAQAKSIPQFEIAVVSQHEEVLDDQGVQLEVTVDLRLKQTKPLPATKKGPMKLFRRTRIDQLLAQPKQFDLAVVLVKPSQRIVVSVSCELLAGSEVKLVVKPESKASDFPIPSLGPSEDSEEAKSTTSKRRPGERSTLQTVPEAAPAAKKRAEPPKAAATIATASPASCQRPDGRYECNHSCANKTACKHLCCREGLDKPPVKRTKSKTAADRGSARKTAGASMQPSAPTLSKQQPLRLQPAPSSRVTLNKTAGGRFTTTQDDDVGYDISDTGELLAHEKVPQTKTQAAPRIDSLATTVDGEIDELGSTPSPPLPPPGESTAPRPPKVKRSLLETDRVTAEARKRRRLSLREFASSSPIDLSNTPVIAAPKSRQTPMDDEVNPLFRFKSSGPSKAFEAVLMDEGESPFNFHVSDDEQGFDGVGALSIGHRVKDDGLGTGSGLEAMLDASCEEADEGTGGDEDDFDAWLAKSVVVM
ncbi:DNA/RNA helicase, DEAD/DEAH boxtype [Rhodotorula toruloides]|uniref:DNA 3'-5' helicase n=1 Tax=Rhodotorula toruloides TaxID=5286 RepID=A0A511KMS0_RHOTO|nr:DNA/RNA helicase, DEAD/DEAH boxtype [Rhodotorula toruloides]